MIKKEKRPITLQHKWDKKSTLLENIRRLQKIIGALSYVSNNTMPDSSYARKVHKGTKVTFRMAKRMLKYLLEKKIMD